MFGRGFNPLYLHHKARSAGLFYAQKKAPFSGAFYLEYVDLEWFHADAGEVGECNLSIDNLHAVEAVVGDEKVAIEVGKVHERSELSGGAHCTRSFGHTSHHEFHVERASDAHHLICFVETGALHQLDVDAVVGAIGTLHIGEAL